MDGAVQLSVTLPLPGVATTPVGAVGLAPLASAMISVADKAQSYSLTSSSVPLRKLPPVCRLPIRSPGGALRVPVGPVPLPFNTPSTYTAVAPVVVLRVAST